MMKLLDAVSTQGVTTVNQNPRNSLSNIILQSTKLANVKSPRFVVEVHDGRCFVHVCSNYNFKLIEMDPDLILQYQAQLCQDIAVNHPQILQKIDYLLGNGYPVNLPIVKETGQSLLMLAAASINCGVDVLIRILQANPDVNQKDNIHRTALHLACRAGRLLIVRVLLQVEGIDTDLRTVGGDTPLMYAVLSKQQELVLFCLENQFNPFLYNGIKWTARDYAIRYKSGDEIVQFIEQAIE